MKKGPVVELLATPMNGSMAKTAECQPEVPLGMTDQADRSSLLIEGT